jgi:hypothetical protein
LPPAALEKDGSLSAIKRVFGWDDGFPRALFYEARCALRFDLGGFETGPERALRVMTRAKGVALSLFSESTALTAFASFYDWERRTTFALRSFKALAAMGFTEVFGKLDKVRLKDEDLSSPSGMSLCRYWSRADFINDRGRLEVLLSASVSDALPKVFLSFYIVDLDRGLALHAYDDRGMDVCGPSKAELSPIYREFKEWLLNHDRPAMDKMFS